MIRNLKLVAFTLLVGAAFAHAAPGPAGGAGLGPVEKEMDLPLDRPVLKKPEPRAPTLPPPPEIPFTPPPPTIYGKDIHTENGTICYVLDISSSMWRPAGAYTKEDGTVASGSRLDHAKVQLVKSVTSLPKSFKFDVIAYDCSIYVYRGMLVQADDDAKTAACNWIRNLKPLGLTGTGPAVSFALKASPELKLVTLLTDGEPNCGAGPTGSEFDSAVRQAHRDMIQKNNVQHATIDVYGIAATGLFRQFCVDVASDSGGTYTDVN